MNQPIRVSSPDWEIFKVVAEGALEMLDKRYGYDYISKYTTTQYNTFMRDKRTRAVFIQKNDEGVIMGLIAGQITDSICTEAFWYVKKDYQGTGVGTQLLTALEDWAKENGCNTMVIAEYIENGTENRGYKPLQMTYSKRLT